MRPIDKDYLLKHQRKVKFFGLGPDDESWGYAVPTEIIEKAPTLTPQNEPLTIEQLREMKDEPAYLKVFDPLLQSGWHIIKAVTADKIIFRGWEKVYVPIDSLGTAYNLYRHPPERQEDT